MVPWPLYVSDLVDPWWIPCQNRISKLPRGRFGGDCSIQPLDIGLHIASDSVSELFGAHVAMGQGTCSSPDLPLLLANSRRVGLGLYNSISAVAATELEIAMFVVGTAIYVTHRVFQQRSRRQQTLRSHAHE